MDASKDSARQKVDDTKEYAPNGQYCIGWRSASRTDAQGSYPLKPKTLSIREMWMLYKTLESGLEKPKEYLIDEILTMLEKISQEDFLQSLLILYPKIVFSKLSSVEMATLFIAGLKKNDFFAFVDVVQGMKHGNA